MNFHVDFDHDVVFDKAREMVGRIWEILGHPPEKSKPRMGKGPIARGRIQFLKAYEEKARTLSFKPHESFNAVSVAVSERLRPGDEALCACDWNRRERVVNVLTSIPYALVGLQMARETKGTWANLTGYSQVAVGAVAAIYHASTGRSRVWCRRADYWTIALGSAAMTRAVYPHARPAWTLASAALTPFAPFATSTLNTCAMELEFLKRARRTEKLKQDFIQHLALAGTGLAMFAVDDYHPGIPLMHSAWHMLSCAAAQRTLPLLKEIEAEKGKTPYVVA